MSNTSILHQISGKDADVTALAEQVIAKPGQIPEIVAALTIEKSTAKYAYEKVLRFISQRRPELLYPYFNAFTDLLDCDNSFLKWGAIMTIANLTAVDTQEKFEPLFDRYYAPITGPTMVTAANIIGSSAKIAMAKPHLTDAIVRQILRVQKAKYEHHARPSPECRNVAIGQAIDSFDQLFDQIDDKATVLRFVKKQLKNTRKPVVKKAERFLRKHRKP